MVTFKGANLITVTFQTKPHWPPGHRELAFLRTFNFHATTGALTNFDISTDLGALQSLLGAIATADDVL